MLIASGGVLIRTRVKETAREAFPAGRDPHQLEARSSPDCSASSTATTKMAKTATATTRAKAKRKAKKAAVPRKATARKAPATRRSVKPAARIFNFGAGPATMPVEVLEKAKWELVNWHDAGMSVMEMSHRGKEFIAIASEAEADLRKLAVIPADYKVLFLRRRDDAFLGRADELLPAASIDFGTPAMSNKRREARNFAPPTSCLERTATSLRSSSRRGSVVAAAYLNVFTNDTIAGVVPLTPTRGRPARVRSSSHPVAPARGREILPRLRGAQKNIVPRACCGDVREDRWQRDSGRPLSGLKKMADADSM